MTPRRRGDVYVYDRSSSGSQSDYDVPPPPIKLDTGQPNPRLSGPQHLQQPTYDTPRSSQVSIEDFYDVPRNADCDSNRSSTFSMMSSGSTLSSASNVSYPSPGSGHDTSNDSMQHIYDVPPSRRSRTTPSTPGHANSTCHATTNSTSFTGDLNDLYDTPPKLSKKLAYDGCNSSNHVVDYDVIPAQHGGKLDDSADHDYASPDELSPKTGPKSCAIIAAYDVPLGERREFSTPPPLPPSVGDCVYDIPPQVTKDLPPVAPTSAALRKSASHSSVDRLESGMKHLSTGSQDSRGSAFDMPAVNYDQLPLQVDAAMDQFVKLQQDLQSATSRLLAFVSSSWRQRQNLEVHIYSIQMACGTFQTAYRQFVTFAQGALANSTSASDRNLAHKLYKALLPLQCALDNLDKHMANLQAMKWDVSLLAVEYKGTLNKKADSLGAIIASAQDLLSDLRIVVSIVQANASLLFPQKKDDGVLRLPDGRVIEKHVSVPLPSPPKEGDADGPGADDAPKEKAKANDSDYENDGKEWMDEYDYVHMEEKRDGLVKRATKKKKKREKAADHPLENTVQLPPADKHLLVFYSAQVQNQSVMLNDSIDTFLACIEQNQPPKVFVANSKFVVLNAHKMVYIGDTLHRNLLQADVRTNIMHGANNLCEILKRTLLVTKTAALQYPAIVAIQDMVDRVVDVSNTAHQLKMVITTAAALDIFTQEDS